MLQLQAYSPTRFATGAIDGTVATWDAVTGSNLSRVKSHTDPIAAMHIHRRDLVSFSANGRFSVHHEFDQHVRILVVVLQPCASQPLFAVPVDANKHAEVQGHQARAVDV